MNKEKIHYIGWICHEEGLYWKTKVDFLFIKIDICFEYIKLKKKSRKRLFAKYWKTLGEQFSHWSQSVWLHVRQILFVKPYFLQQHSNPAKKLVNLIFLDFCKDFCNFSHSVLLDKISSPQLGDGVARWVNTKGYSEGVTSGCHWWGSAGIHLRPSSLQHLH